MNASFLIPIIGLAIGFLSGVFGVGGGVMSTPILRLLLGAAPLIALGTPLPATIPTALAGVYNYLREKKINREVALPCAGGGLIGTIGGSFATGFLPVKGLMLLTAGLIGLVGIDFLLGRRSLKERPSEEKEIFWPSLFIGLMGGFLSGLLGLGGGVFFVPAFLLVLRMPLKTALGTSLLVVSAVAIPGSIIHWRLGHVDSHLLFLLTIGMIPGAFSGSLLAMKANDRRLKGLYGFFLAAIAILFAWEEAIY
ncbi:MAG TPA: sulfite exporter TauE/SafE family protein [Chroococcales cyanobacterium]|jgi:hypothetical protein